MRNRILAIGLALVSVLGSVALVGSSQQQEAPKIEPKADQYLKAMSSYLAGLQTYSFQVEKFIDEVRDDGQKLQFSNQRNLSVSRPNKVYGEDVGDTANSLFYYDGKNIQYSRVINGTATIVSGAAETIYGDELSAELHPTRSLTLNAGVTMLHGTFGNFPNAPSTIRLPDGIDIAGPATFNAKGNTTPFAAAGSASSMDIVGLRRSQWTKPLRRLDEAGHLLNTQDRWQTLGRLRVRRVVE